MRLMKFWLINFKKNIQFLTISLVLKKILRDRNYKNNAVKQPNTIRRSMKLIIGQKKEL